VGLPVPDFFTPCPCALPCCWLFWVARTRIPLSLLSFYIAFLLPSYLFMLNIASCYASQAATSLRHFSLLFMILTPLELLSSRFVGDSFFDFVFFPCSPLAHVFVVLLLSRLFDDYFVLGLLSLISSQLDCCSPTYYGVGRRCFRVFPPRSRSSFPHSRFLSRFPIRPFASFP